MSIRKNYFINVGTIAVHSIFHHGDEYAGVLKVKDYFIVKQSPLTIVENSFLEIGNELDGARKSSRYILKKKINVPVALSVSNNIILIQCKAASKLGGMVWIVAKHIVDIQAYRTNQTLIHTTGGHTLIVDMNPEKLQRIRNLAANLQVILQENQKLQISPTRYAIRNNGYMLVNGDWQINYFIKRKK